jgi:hypothetical protein
MPAAAAPAPEPDVDAACAGRTDDPVGEPVGIDVRNRREARSHFGAELVRLERDRRLQFGLQGGAKVR